MQVGIWNDAFKDNSQDEIIKQTGSFFEMQKLGEQQHVQSSAEDNFDDIYKRADSIKKGKDEKLRDGAIHSMMDNFTLFEEYYKPKEFNQDDLVSKALYEGDFFTVEKQNHIALKTKDMLT